MHESVHFGAVIAMERFKQRCGYSAFGYLPLCQCFGCKLLLVWGYVAFLCAVQPVACAALHHRLQVAPVVGVHCQRAPYHLFGCAGEVFIIHQTEYILVDADSQRQEVTPDPETVQAVVQFPRFQF